MREERVPLKGDLLFYDYANCARIVHFQIQFRSISSLPSADHACFECSTVRVLEIEVLSLDFRHFVNLSLRVFSRIFICLSSSACAFWSTSPDLLHILLRNSSDCCNRGIMIWLYSCVSRSCAFMSAFSLSILPSHASCSDGKPRSESQLRDVFESFRFSVHL